MYAIRSYYACVGGGSNSIGLFHPFIKDEGVRMIGVEAGGFGICIISTSKGILIDEDCRQKGIGGEVLCRVW